MNLTHFLCKLTNLKKTNEIVIEKLTGAATVTPIANRNYLLVPDGFNISKLIVPGNPSTQDIDTLSLLKTYASLQNPDLTDATIKFADRPSLNSYNLMLKTANNQYKQLAGTMDSASGQINIISVTTTNYKDSDFGSCGLFSPEGICLSCSQSQLEYQGNCWEKIEGCLYQAGPICLKCSGKYILKNRLCIKDCEQLIN